MHSRAKSDPSVIAALPRVAPAADALEAALDLADAHAFAVADDGALKLSDPARLERALVLRPGTLQTSRAAWEARLAPGDVRARRRALAMLSWSGARVEIDYPVRDGRGETRAFRERVAATGPDGALQLRGVLIDRTDAARAQSQAVWAARHDAVTRLENRDVLAERAETLAALATRLGNSATLLRLRLTNLSDLATVYGADLVDRMLGLVARRLEVCVRKPDALAKLSEADFGLAVLDADIEGLGARLQADIADAPYSTPYGPLYLDIDIASVRLSPLPGGGEAALSATRDTLEGKLAERVRPAALLGPDVVGALESDAISIAFQPIVEAHSGTVHHHECLLRQRGPDGRMVSAWELIQSAERLGLIAKLDERALDLAVPHLRRHADLHLALNVSAGTLQDPQTAARYVERLRGLGSIAARVTIEMTETIAVDDPAAAARFSADVRALGCRFAVDDFGSGYTTFRNLMAVEADSLKIDGALIRGIATDESKQTFMRMMVDLAHTFAVSTVAEMVETEADAAILRRLGADYLQGYHFGQPAPAPVWSSVA